jgi:exopolysaccharide biosynthesis WecB/TagA/CpsF family protein
MKSHLKLPVSPRPRRQLVLGLPFSPLTSSGALERCLEIVRRREPRHVITANTDFLAKAEGDPEVRRLMFEADEVFCDGMPLVWASRLFVRPGGGLPDRVTGSDLVPRLLERLAAAGKSVFFLGSDEATLERLREKLSRDLPALRIAGLVSPPMGPIGSWDNAAYVEAIRRSKPDVLLVAVGFPKQDQWISRFRDQIRVPLMIGVGASLDFIAGKQVRAPRWMQRSGLEWVWRLGTDPKRLARRYLDDAIVFGRVIGRQLRATLLNHLPVWSARPSSSQALLNGVSFQSAHVVRWESGGRLSQSGPGIAMAAGSVADVSGVEAMEEGLIGLIAETARQARLAGRRFAIFGAGPRLQAWMRDFGLSEVWPHFESPAALAAWLGGRSLPATTLECARRGFVFEKAVAELFRGVGPAGPDEVRVDLRRIGSLSRLGADRLIDFKHRAESAGHRVVFENLSDLGRDSLEILELNRRAA